MPTIHKKVWPTFFEKILSGEKRFELRLADFEVNKGDELVLEEWDPATKEYTGRSASVIATYIVKTKDVSFWSAEEVDRYGYQVIQFETKSEIKSFTGAIIEESLEDSRFINEFIVKGVHISRDDSPADRWHIYTVQATQEQVEALSHNLRPGPWYAHFWNDEDMIVVYRGKVFMQKRYDQTTWESARAHGRSIGIPEAQLNFLTS